MGATCTKSGFEDTVPKRNTERSEEGKKQLITRQEWKEKYKGRFLGEEGRLGLE
jgi:hypothetical protein